MQVDDDEGNPSREGGPNYGNNSKSKVDIANLDVHPSIKFFWHGVKLLPPI